MLGGDSLILFDVMRVEFVLHVLSYHDNPLIRLFIIVRVIFCLQCGFPGCCGVFIYSCVNLLALFGIFCCACV